MAALRLLPSFLLATSVAAAPLVSQPHALLKREFPEFEDEHNFGEGQEDIIKNALPDAIDLVTRVTENYEGYKDIWSNYFPEDDHETVMEVFQRIVPEADDPGEGDDRLKNARISGYNFFPAMGKGDPCAEGSAAYTSNWVDEKENPLGFSRTHFCPPAYEQPPKYEDMKCTDLGDTVSDKMDFLGATVMHEWIHNDDIGTEVIGERIIDVDGLKGYGPANVRRMLSDNPEKVKLNADSYTWLAIEVFWTKLCLKDDRYKAPSSGGFGDVIEEIGGIIGDITGDDEEDEDDD
ncbi:hypothetical protein HJFPF1_09653 [Paramyrothecium foliicola]|nr:hypothetical protein HJFPF1_09653 [Paramyrothecium foliicola]